MNQIEIGKFSLYYTIKSNIYIYILIKLSKIKWNIIWNWILLQVLDLFVTKHQLE